MTTEILKYPQTYAIFGIIISLIYLGYIQIVSNVMYIKYLILKRKNRSKKFNSLKYDLATSVGFNFLLISILALVYIECNL